MRTKCCSHCDRPLRFFDARCHTCRTPVLPWPYVALILALAVVLLILMTDLL
jgi:hypothetical protein